MPELPGDAAVARAVSAARNHLSPEDVSKLENLAKNSDALKGLTSNMSQKDWAMVMKVINDPDLLRRVLGSSQGKNVLHDFLNRIN